MAAAFPFTATEGAAVRRLLPRQRAALAESPGFTDQVRPRPRTRSQTPVPNKAGLPGVCSAVPTNGFIKGLDAFELEDSMCLESLDDTRWRETPRHCWTVESGRQRFWHLYEKRARAREEKIKMFKSRF